MVVSATDSKVKQALVDVLAGGGVAICPCDTIYGFLGIYPEAQDRIRAVKGRAESHRFLVLVADIEAVETLITVPLDPRIAGLWPAPLTVVLPVSGGTLAIRIPADRFIRDLVQTVGRPLVSTSVNKSGSAALGAVRDIRNAFEASVDLVVDGGDLLDRTPSTILDATVRPYRILRDGAFTVPEELLTGR